VTTFVDSDQDYFYSSAAHAVNDWFGNGQPEYHSLNSVFYKLNLELTIFILPLLMTCIYPTLAPLVDFVEEPI
jgi:hypothetical protein